MPIAARATTAAHEATIIGVFHEGAGFDFAPSGVVSASVSASPFGAVSVGASGVSSTGGTGSGASMFGGANVSIGT